MIIVLEGIYAPIPTPFDNNDALYFEGLKKNLDWWGQSSIRGLVVAGTNGEAALLDQAEKLKLFSYAREHLPAEKSIIAGTGCESAKATIELNRETANCGVDAALVITPYYFKGAMTEDTLYEYYLRIAEESPLPVVLYNMPRNTGVNISATLACRLSGHPNIFGIKDSSGDITQIQTILRNASPGFQVSAGSAGFLLPSLAIGAVGATAALANIMPEECVDIIRFYREGNLEKARQLQLKIMEINAAVTSRWGVPGLKYALDMIGFYGGPPRSPLRPLGEPEKALLKEIWQSAKR